MGRKKSARFEKDEEEATPAENVEMIEAENNYGVTFRNYTDFCKWKEVQGLNRQVMANSSQAPILLTNTENANVAVGRAPHTVTNFGSSQPQILASEGSSLAQEAVVSSIGSSQQVQHPLQSHAGNELTHSSTSATSAPTSAAHRSNTSSGTNAAPTFGRGQPQGADHALAGANSSATRNDPGLNERICVTVQIPESKTKFLIGTGGRTIKHLQRTWNGVEINLRTQLTPHTLNIRGVRSDLEQFLLHVGSFLDENLTRYMPAASVLSSATPSSSQVTAQPRQKSPLIHRHYSVPPGVAGQLIGSGRNRQKQLENTHKVLIGFFEGGAKCRISATAEASIHRALNEMNRIIRPAALGETPAPLATPSQAHHVNVRGQTVSTNRETMRLPRCNRSDFGGYRRGLSVANLGRLVPPPANVPLPALTAEEEEIQVTADDGLLSTAVEIEKLELEMKNMLPVQHSAEALHTNALWKAYLAAFLYVADNNYRQRRPPANTIRVFSFPANWTFAEIQQLLEGYDIVDVVRKRHGVRDYTLSSKGFVTFRNVVEAERADQDVQKWSDAGIEVELLRTEVSSWTGQIEPNWRMFDVARLMRIRLIHAILSDEGFSGERWRSRPYREQREYYKRKHEESIGSGRQQQEQSNSQEDAQNGAKLRDSKHLFQIKRALYSYFKPTHFEGKRASEHESYKWPREDVFEHLDRIYATDNTTLEDIETELRYFDRAYRDDMLYQWRTREARWSDNIEPKSGWQFLSIPGHYEVDEMIDTVEGLRRWTTYLRCLPFDDVIALDIEGSTHGPNGLQLAQLSTFNKACIVDIAKCRNLPEFTGLLEAIYYSRALKCDHDGNDFRELSRFLPGAKPFRCITTPYLINRFNLRKRRDLGLDDKPRIGHVVAEYLGVMMRKGMACSAWNHRPLTKGQTLYALLDSVAVALLAHRCYEEDKQRFLALAKEDYHSAM